MQNKNELKIKEVLEIKNATPEKIRSGAFSKSISRKSALK